MNFRKTFFCVCVFFLFAPSAFGKGEISVSDSWVRLPPPGVNITAAYMVIRNGGARDDALESVRCDCSLEASLHLTRTLEGSDSVSMEKTPFIEIPSGKTVSLKPRGYHVMLEGLAEDIGDRVLLKLKFREFGELEISSPVKKTAASAKPHTQDHHH